jgi:MinD superfamily P-loop ATPase
MRIAFASGKGGTGKTTLAVNMAYLFSLSGFKVEFLDLDVEEPNGHIFLKPQIESIVPVKVFIPLFDKERCTFCQKCVQACSFHAIFMLGKDILLFQELCHSCKLCLRICEEKAIKEGEREVGVVRIGKADSSLSFIEGRLNVREPRPMPVIEAVKSHCKGGDVQIIDAPPGTACPFVRSVYDSDFVVLVTEPTPFGLHDLEKCVSFLKSIKRPFGLVINKERGKFPPLEEYVSQNQILVLGRIQEDLRIAKALSEGKILLNELPEYRVHFEEIFSNLKRAIHGRS